MLAEVANTDLRVLAWLQHRFGGRIVASTEYRANRRTCYHWRLKTDASAEFLGLIRPFLVVKHRECDEALEAYALKRAA